MGTNVDLSHLSHEHSRIVTFQTVKEMLKEESGAFARDDGNTGCAEDL